jgi:hypothetical protein
MNAARASITVDVDGNEDVFGSPAAGGATRCVQADVEALAVSHRPAADCEPGAAERDRIGGYYLNSVNPRRHSYI